MPNTVVARTIQTVLLKPVHRFFVSDSTQSDDRLVDLVRHDPVSGIQGIKSIALFSIVWNFVGGGACAMHLGAYWSQCDECDQRLKWWLLAQAALQLSQLPVRAVLFWSVRGAEPAGGSVESNIKSITAAPAWRISKKIALLQYAWFLLGIVWMLRLKSCPDCPGIWRLVALLILFSLLRAVVALAAFRDKLAGVLRPILEQGALFSEATTNPATPGQIAALPIIRFSEDETFLGSDSGCSICLADFEIDSQLKQLPCRHAFHCACLDQWLQRSKRCPLCMRPVDDPPSNADSNSVTGG